MLQFGVLRSKVAQELRLPHAVHELHLLLPGELLGIFRLPGTFLLLSSRRNGDPPLERGTAGTLDIDAEAP